MRYEYSLAEGPDSALGYVRWAAARLPQPYQGLDWGRAEAAYLDAGIMNYVYRVAVDGVVFYLKQALARVKQHERLGPDLAGVSPARIGVEHRALTRLAGALPAGKVPRVAWYDPDNNVLWTEEIAAGGISLQAALQAGECDGAAAEELGGLLARVHGARRSEIAPLWPTAEEDRENWLRFLKMRTTGFLTRAELPPAAEAVTRELYAEGDATREEGMVSHLDAAPKNVLLTSSGPRLLDFELGAAVSDPAYDPGFLAGHYLLMGENDPAIREASVAAAEGVRRGYRAAARKLDAGWDRRFRRYAALTMLYRLYGSSPAPYLSPSRYQEIRAEGLRRLLEG